MSVRRLVRRGRVEAGFTLIELVAVMTILLTVLTALTSLFVSGTNAELDMNRRFQAQQEARLAVDRLRREVHCGNGVVLVDADKTTDPDGAVLYRKITVKVPIYCLGGDPADPTVNDVVWATAAVPGSSQRWELKRDGVRVADYVTREHVFSYFSSVGSLARVHVALPVNVNPNEGWKQWRLKTDIVLRNSTRS